MLGEVNKRFGQVEKVPMFSIATLLVPRFKKLDFNSPVDFSHAVSSLRNMLLQNRPSLNILDVVFISYYIIKISFKMHKNVIYLWKRDILLAPNSLE